MDVMHGIDGVENRRKTTNNLKQRINKKVLKLIGVNNNFSLWLSSTNFEPEAKNVNEHHWQRWQFHNYYWNGENWLLCSLPPSSIATPFFHLFHSHWLFRTAQFKHNKLTSQVHWKTVNRVSKRFDDLALPWDRAKKQSADRRFNY